MKPTPRFLLYSQLLLAASLAISTYLVPDYLFSNNQGGVSNFGTRPETLALFVLGFIGCGALILLAARALPANAKHRTGMKVSLTIIGILCLLVAITTFPYKINEFFNLLHIYTSVALFLAQVPISLWYTFVVLRQSPAFLLQTLFVLGFVLAVFTFLGHIFVLFIAEVVCIFTFGALMVLAGRKSVA